MIRIFSGNLGSGKTACAVREMILNDDGRKVYTNIIAKKRIRNHILLSKDMIIKEDVDKVVVNKTTGKETATYKYSVNLDFWKAIKEPKHVVIDEAHTIYSNRRSMSKKNIIISEWIAMLRRVLGRDEYGYGMLTLITQVPYKIDKDARDLCTHFRHHRCHFIRTCSECRFSWHCHSDMPEDIESCPRCRKGRGRKHSLRIEVWHYASLEHFENNVYHAHYFINDIENVFPFYDTLQWDNLLD